jgi:hypothetical protein
VARGRRPEGGHGVGDRLDTGHRRGARREGAQYQQHGDALDRIEADDRCRRKAAGRGIHQPHGDQREHGQHEGVRRRGEDRAGLAHAAQVARQQDRDRRQAQRNGVVGHTRDGGGDRRDTSGDRHGHGEDVLGHQGARHDQGGELAEVPGGDDVGPSAVRVGPDELSVGQPDGDHEYRDRHRDLDREAQRAAAGQRQHGEHRFGSVGHRREGVRRENRERHRLAHPLVRHRAAVQRRPQEHPTARRCQASRPRGSRARVRCGHDFRRVAGLDEVDRREAVGAARRQREWEPMQTGIDRQCTHPRRPRAQCAIPVTAHLAQDGELVLI